MKYALSLMAALGIAGILGCGPHLPAVHYPKYGETHDVVYARCIRAEPFTRGYEHCREEANAIIHAT